MAKRIQSDLKASSELERLLSWAKEHPPTEEELQEQRISFAYGNLALHDPRVTKDDVRRAVEHLRLTTTQKREKVK
jgi:hypothetical protein